MKKTIKVPFSVTVKIQIGDSDIDAQVTGEAEYDFRLVDPDPHGTKTGVSSMYPRYSTQPSMGIIKQDVKYDAIELLNTFDREVKDAVWSKVFEEFKPETPEVK